MIRADLDRFLDEAMGQESWALVRLRDSDTVTVLGGPLVPASLLKYIELPEGPPALGRRFDHLAAVPFLSTSPAVGVPLSCCSAHALLPRQSEHTVRFAAVGSHLHRCRFDCQRRCFGACCRPQYKRQNGRYR